MFDAWPGMFGKSGCGMIIIWGFAYASVAFDYRHVPLLVLVFCLEKVYYTIAYFGYRQALKRENPGAEYNFFVFSIPQPLDVEPKLFGIFDFPFVFFFGYVFIAILEGSEAP